MSLKYKLGDVVVLGENVDTYKGFMPGVAVRIGELCNAGAADEHYTIYTLGGKGRVWWVYEDEINHKATEELQESNETVYIVGKEQAVSDDNDKEVRTPALEGSDENGWFKRGELPPVGANIEYKLGAGPWFDATVKYVLDVLDGDEDEIVIACPHLGFEQLLTLNKHTKIRPTVTPEQIAKQEREAYCDRIYSVLCNAERKNNRSDMAESLYDAGLRFVGEVE